MSRYFEIRHHAENRFLISWTGYSSHFIKGDLLCSFPAPNLKKQTTADSSRGPWCSFSGHLLFMQQAVLALFPLNIQKV